MRTLRVALVILGGLMVITSLPVGWRAHSFAQEASTAPAVVKMLLAGPLHARIEVTPGAGRPFTYIENSSRRPLSVGQRVSVRYDPERPEGSAQLATVGVYRTAVEVALTGLLMILMALAAPVLARRPTF